MNAHQSISPSSRDAGAAAQEDVALEPDRQGWVRCLSMSGFHRMAYSDWGPADALETVVCVHGLTRQGRDFDYLAQALVAGGYRVICPDLVGRGQSGWMPHVLDYVFPQYCADIASLIATLGPTSINWVGSSLGGLIGIVLASMPNTPIAKLVINDIGPNVPISAAMRLGTRIASFPTTFSSLEEAVRLHRSAFVDWGDLTDAQWRHITVHGVREDVNLGCYVSRTDSKIATAYQWLLYYRMTLWSYWEQIDAPVLVVHGERSDFMPPHLLRAMRRSAPQMQIHGVPGAGHMPMLMSAAEIAAVSGFLQS
jgi:pimeloyl-ACP methyl ester carboxylesterase